MTTSIFSDSISSSAFLSAYLFHPLRGSGIKRFPRIHLENFSNAVTFFFDLKILRMGYPFYLKVYGTGYRVQKCAFCKCEGPD